MKYFADEASRAEWKADFPELEMRRTKIHRSIATKTAQICAWMINQLSRDHRPVPLSVNTSAKRALRAVPLIMCALRTRGAGVR